MNDPFIETQLRSHSMQFQTTWGLFSPKKIDWGTQLLLEQMDIQGHEDILDLGCGYGPIGLTLAKETSGTVHLVDKDFVAIEYVEKNAKLNNLDNTKIYLSNGLREVPINQEFDIVVSNIPAKVGRELLRKMLTDAHAKLKPEGKVYLVTIAGLKEFMKTEMKNAFGNYKKLKYGKGYVCALSLKKAAD